MYRIFYTLLLLLSINLTAQNTDVVSWLNNNAVSIEDANPDTKLVSFAKNESQLFRRHVFLALARLPTMVKNFLILKPSFLNMW